jgi:Outer membrane protein beta-barrel domain
MKKLLLLVTLVSIGFTNAQTKEKGTIEITPKIGYSRFNQQSEKEYNGYNPAVEFSGTIDYYFNTRWSLRSGLVYSKMRGRGIILDGFFEDQLNYLSIPLNANWHFGSTRKWNLNFGLSPSFLTSGSAATNDYSTSNMDVKIVKPFQLGMTFGFGYKIEITKKFGILLDGQWFNGLTNIAKSGSYIFTNSGFTYNIGGVIEL